jgi:adenine-specific DNA-methyltransferase
VEKRLIVEADGGQHEVASDRRRSDYLERLGWKVLRFWNHDVLQRTDAVLATILVECEARQKEKPSPCPLPHAGEGR